MKKIVLSLAFLIAFLIPHNASAATIEKTGVAAHPQMAVVTFRLHVSGQFDPAATYWIAYGPLGGKFGIIQLHGNGSGLFTASRTLPALGRTVFAYLAGRGSIYTRAGLAPGNPVVTIRRLGPVSVAAGSLPTVQWQAPVG